MLKIGCTSIRVVVLILFNVFLTLHVLGGFTALLIFWIPIIARKGGKLHVRIGWVFVYAMGLVSVSAWYMAAHRIFFDPASDFEKITFSWFLMYVGVLSGASAWYGIRVLHHKNRSYAHRNVLDLGFSLLLLISGIGMFLYGNSVDVPLFKWFSLIGIIHGTYQLYYWLRRPKHKMHWWFEHLGGMLSCCIATITAFVVFSAPRLLNIDTVNPILWFLPAMVLVPVKILFTRYYKRKFKVNSKIPRGNENHNKLNHAGK